MKNPNSKDFPLPDSYYNALSDEDKAKYARALMLCKRENAHGPLGGWADGCELLKELGFKEVKRTEGHRAFISLIPPKGM